MSAVNNLLMQKSIFLTFQLPFFFFFLCGWGHQISLDKSLIQAKRNVMLSWCQSIDLVLVFFTVKILCNQIIQHYCLHNENRYFSIILCRFLDLQVFFYIICITAVFNFSDLSLSLSWNTFLFLSKVLIWSFQQSIYIMARV